MKSILNNTTIDRAKQFRIESKTNQNSANVVIECDIHKLNKTSQLFFIFSFSSPPKHYIPYRKKAVAVCFMICARNE